MKTLITSLLVTLTAGLCANAMADGEHHGHGAMHAAAAAETELADGLVKKIDKAAGKVTLAHGALPSGMPAMTMAYRVKEAAWIDQMKPGQKIRFAAEQIKGVMTIVQFEPGK